MYLRTIIIEWINRGYKNNMTIPDKIDNYLKPFWLGDDKFHASHRSNLKRKNPNFYKFDEPLDLPYVWPII